MCNNGGNIWQFSTQWSLLCGPGISGWWQGVPSAGAFHPSRFKLWAEEGGLQVFVRLGKSVYAQFPKIVCIQDWCGHLHKAFARPSNISRVFRGNGAKITAGRNPWPDTRDGCLERCSLPSFRFSLLDQKKQLSEVDLPARAESSNCLLSR